MPESETKGAVGNDNGPEEVGDEKDADNDGMRDEADKEKEEERAQKGPSVFSVDQSAITGESIAVDECASRSVLLSPLRFTLAPKLTRPADIGDDVYYTTNAKRGKVLLVAVNIAKQLFVGKTAQLGTGTGGTGHVQQVGHSLLILCAAIPIC